MVGFRIFVLHHAAGLRGRVTNLADGSVECVVEGPARDVDRLVALLHQGPVPARVDAVEVTREPYRGDLPPFTVTA